MKFDVGEKVRIITEGYVKRVTENGYDILLEDGEYYTCMENELSKIKENDMKDLSEMELKDTVDLMNSEDYKDRFRAEYFQTKIRYDKLHKMVVKYDAGTLGFEPVCAIDLLKHQKSLMGQYLFALEVRAQKEGIDLGGF